MVVSTSGYLEAGRDSDIAKKYSFTKISEKDLKFTYDMCDDRINCTVSLSDYDWMSYMYDMRFPTKNLGTLVIRQEYSGTTKCRMIVKQFLPHDFTGESGDLVVYRAYEYPYQIFEKYMVEDLHERIRNVETDSEYAYYPGRILVKWFNEVIENFEEIDADKSEIQDSFKWQFVTK